MGKNNTEARKKTLRRVEDLEELAYQHTATMDSLRLHIEEVKSELERTLAGRDQKIDTQRMELRDHFATDYAELRERIEALEKPWWRKLFSRRAWRAS